MDLQEKKYRVKNKSPPRSYKVHLDGELRRVDKAAQDHARHANANQKKFREGHIKQLQQEKTFYVPIDTGCNSCANPDMAENTECTDPYPITFGVQSQKKDTAHSRRRSKLSKQPSKELEDLHLNPHTGALSTIRTREILDMEQRTRASSFSKKPPTGKENSPQVARRKISAGNSKHKSDKNDLSLAQQAAMKNINENQLKGLRTERSMSFGQRPRARTFTDGEMTNGGTWLGEPAAISSVRRARKSVVEQRVSPQASPKLRSRRFGHVQIPGLPPCIYVNDPEQQLLDEEIRMRSQSFGSPKEINVKPKKLRRASSSLTDLKKKE